MFGMVRIHALQIRRYLCLTLNSTTSVNIGNYTVFSSDDTDGFGYLTVKDAVSIFHHIYQGLQFYNELE